MAVYLGNNPVSVYNGGQPIIVESGQYAWERYEYLGQMELTNRQQQW